MHKSRRVKITDLNPHITCVLCSGYLIDATTIIECLHSFCRTCIVKYLEHNKYCPICEVQVHKTKPLLNIRSDQTLQDVVYKLVPGLFQNEMCRRRDYYAKHPDQKPMDAESRGEVTQFSHIYTPDESISLSLEYYNNNIPHDNDNNAAETKIQAPHPSRRFLRCPAAVTVAHLQKLIRAKYGLSNEHRVDILYKNDRLSEDFTLMDIAYIYLWRRKGPLHLTYRIFEVAKRLKLNDQLENQEIKSEKMESEDIEEKNEWKEVQLQISENGVMSVTNIGETKKSETVTSNFEVKTDVNLIKTENIPELSPIEPKSEKPDQSESVKVETNKSEEIVTQTEEKETKLGKHKLQDDNTNETSAKIMKPNNLTNNNPDQASVAVKNVQQLSRNHPLKMHSQSVNKNHVSVVTPNVKNSNVKAVQQKTVNTQVQVSNRTTNNNNNTTIKSEIKQPVTVQKDQTPAPTTVQSSLPQVQSTPNLTNPKTTLQNATTTQCSTEKTLIVTSSQSLVTSSNSQTQANFTNMTGQNTLKYTQAGQSDITQVTKSEDALLQNNNQKTPISSSSVVSSINNCIQSSKVSIVPKKSSVKITPPMVYKTLRDPPKAWNPQISRQNLSKTTVFPSNNGASTSDLKQRVDLQSKPAKFFKLRNNVPRYLGNPASGVKPMYQVREGDKSPPDVNTKKSDIKKPEYKLNNNNDIKPKQQEAEPRTKLEVKKQSIVKIDPKTLRPITEKVIQESPAPSPSCSDTPPPEMKISQSSVPIFNPLRNQKMQTSPKIDRRSPKTSTTTIASSYMDSPKTLLGRSSPKTNSGKLNSPTSKKDKLNINFTPPNPFIPNLTSPNLAPNQFLYPNFPSYDPRVMNNLTAYHPFSMYYSQPRLNYPGLSSQSLTLSPNLMSSLNLEVNKNLRKNYEMSAMLQLSPNMDNNKKSSTLKSPRENTTEEKSNLGSNEKNSEIKIVERKSQENNKNTKQNEQKQEVTNNSNNKEDNRLKTNSIAAAVNQLQKSSGGIEIETISDSKIKATTNENTSPEKLKKEDKIESKDSVEKNVDKKDIKIDLTKDDIKEKDVVQNEKNKKNENDIEATGKTT